MFMEAIASQSSVVFWDTVVFCGQFYATTQVVSWIFTNIYYRQSI